MPFADARRRIYVPSVRLLKMKRAFAAGSVNYSLYPIPAIQRAPKHQNAGERQSSAHGRSVALHEVCKW